MTDITERLRDQHHRMWNDMHDEAADEIEKLRREIRTLRNFFIAIRADADLALRDYGQPTGEDMAKVGGTYRWVVPPGEGT